MSYADFNTVGLRCPKGGTSARSHLDTVMPATGGPSLFVPFVCFVV